MTLEEFVFATLAGDPAVLALVGKGGSPASARIYPGVAAQQDKLPYIVFSDAGAAPENDLAGLGVNRKRLQIASRAADFDGAAALANAVRQVFGSLALTVPGWGRVTALCVLADLDLFDDQPRSFARSADYSFTYP